MKTKTAFILGTLLCMTYSGVLGYAGFSYPSVSPWFFFWGDFAIFFSLFMLGTRHGVRPEVRKNHDRARGGNSRGRARGRVPGKGQATRGDPEYLHRAVRPRRKPGKSRRAGDRNLRTRQ